MDPNGTDWTDELGAEPQKYEALGWVHIKPFA